MSDMRLSYLNVHLLAVILLKKYCYPLIRQVIEACRSFIVYGVHLLPANVGIPDSLRIHEDQIGLCCMHMRKICEHLQTQERAQIVLLMDLMDSRKDEGIVLKDLGSKWEPSDRSGKWLKLKPDYIRAGSDLDVLIIGGYYGSGRRGGEVAQFLVGLAERPAPNTHPRRVGTGLSDEELNAVVTKLKPYLRSFIVSITSDIRTIRSEVFAAPYSLRFPRIDRVRYDKPWHECLDVQSFIELVHSSNGTMQRATDNAVVQENKPKRTKLSRGAKKNVSVVPSHFIQTDVSRVKDFVNLPSSHSLDSLHKMVVENGGTFSMNLNNSVTQCIASESKGIKFQAAKRQGDVIHYSWFADCCAQKKLLPLQPKFKKLEEEIDEFSDSYFLDLNVTDLKQILSNMAKAEDSKEKEYYKKKFCPREEWVRFHGCCIYFHLLGKSRNWEVPLELAMRRMKIEICSGGGSVAETLSHATHLVIVASPQIDVDFDMLLNSFSEAEKRLLRSRSLQIVKSHWLDDCFEKDQKLPEDSYSLIPHGFRRTLTGESSEHELTGEEHHSLRIGSRDASTSYKDGRKGHDTSNKQPRIVSLPDRSGKRKRGRPSGISTKKGKSVVNKSRRTRPRVGNKPAKIYENESDKSTSLDDKEDFEVSEMVENKGISSSNQPRRTRAQIRNKPAEIGGNELDKGASAEKQTMEEDSGTAKSLIPEIQTSEKGKALEPGIAEHSKCGQRFDEINEVGYGQGSSTQYKDRLEDTVDPIQAMLLNMVPSLATKKVESAIPVPEEVKARDPDPAHGEGKLPLDAGTQPVKKKKVSYKDVANELLRDW
ncbi:hypothetical protein DH2020_034575 [Rehmannia glutinosa]|uniref:DNA ligase 4 n=1 Tax=Rehmannia glutinosa TaxID=99300 RepID=A0ABR0V9N1_REHGL